MDSKNWQRLFQRLPNANKYNYGHVLVIGGSEAMVGAPVLVARAALRTGAGLVTIASTGETTRLIDRDIEEVMTFSLPPWYEVKASVAAIEKFIQERHVSVVVIGPGLSGAADELIRTLLSMVTLPMIVDAEAFTALSGCLPILHAATRVNKKIILTPHSGEYVRLTKEIVISTGLTERENIQKFAQNYAVTLVLKHAHTLVVHPEGGVYENMSGNPGLATAGAGDVLAGILAGIVAQGVEVYEAAKMAVYLHGLVADEVAKVKTEPGMIASDIIEGIPDALKQLSS